MLLRITNPTTCEIEGVEVKKLLPYLRYEDRSVDFEVNRLKRALKYYIRNPQEQTDTLDKINELNQNKKKTLLSLEDNKMSTLSGLAHLLHTKLGLDIINEIKYPSFSPLSYQKEPDPPREYQQQAHDLLLEAKHGAVQIGTGLGKSNIALMLCKTIGLQTLILAPLQNIADQLYELFAECLGVKLVGKFYGGKKDIGKFITIALPQSLTNLEQGSLFLKHSAWDHFSKTQLYMSDESHMVPSHMLKDISLGLVKNAPYRFFFSGTQTRTDGQEKVLQGIIGPIVIDMSVEDGVGAGYLAEPEFRMVQIESNVNYRSDNIARMTARHLQYNPQVLARAGYIANLSVSKLNRQVLILIDEIDQFSCLLPYLKYRVGFAHGPLTKANQKYCPPEHQAAKARELVASFNRGEVPILVGTSCIGMGVDIKPVGACIYLVGGMSEIQVSQAVGRTTRGGERGSVVRPQGAVWWPWGEKKMDCHYWDFSVRLPEDNDYKNKRLSAVARHSLEREAIYRSIHEPVMMVKLN